MKKKYTTPKIILIGDMVNNTLGASGTTSDSGGKSRNSYFNMKNERQIDRTFNRKF